MFNKNNLEEIEFPEENELEQIKYRIFPDKYENKNDILFHGTNHSSFLSIQQNGFQITGCPPSCSFSQNSSLALGYACKKRSPSDQGVIIAISIHDYTIIEEGPHQTTPDKSRYILKSGDCYHLYNVSTQPELIAYCLIPEDYSHI